jgi:hypothetical protein
VSLTKLAALGIGYVLGARAGRERYERIRILAGQAARRLDAYGSGGSLATRHDEHRNDSDSPAGRH